MITIRKERISFVMMMQSEGRERERHGDRAAVTMFHSGKKLTYQRNATACFLSFVEHVQSDVPMIKLREG